MLEKTYDAAAIEPKIATRWAEANAFAAGAGAQPERDSFCIVIPPPNVTGSLHMGHALNNTLQDILAATSACGAGRALAAGHGPRRHRHADGCRAPAGRAADPPPRHRPRSVHRQDLGVESQSGGMIFNQLKRLGASCDWSRERFTMDEGLSRPCWRSSSASTRKG
jgi:valyl-tRNA synthetase